VDELVGRGEKIEDVVTVILYYRQSVSPTTWRWRRVDHRIQGAAEYDRPVQYKRHELHNMYPVATVVQVGT
jgi:hypothetical protein